MKFLQTLDFLMLLCPSITYNLTNVPNSRWLTRIFFFTQVLSAGVLAFHQNSRPIVLRYWAKDPKNRLARDIELATNNKMDILNPTTPDRLTNPQLKDRVLRIQNLFTKSHKHNHYVMLGCGLFGGLFMPMQFSGLLFLYIGLECMNAGNTLWILYKNERGFYDPNRYQQLIGSYLKVVKVLAALSPLVGPYRYTKAMSETEKRLHIKVAELRAKSTPGTTTPPTPATPPPPPAQPTLPPTPPPQ